MRPEVDRILSYYAKRLYEIQFVDIPSSTKKKSIDIDARLCSDVLSCEVPSVSHTSEYILSKCIWWSKAALEAFWDEKIYNKDGTLAHTYRQRRIGYAKNGKRFFNVEHEYPLGILKSKIMNQEFDSEESVKKYLLKYNKATIVTQDEDWYLRVNGQKTANSIKEAADRYQKCGIEVYYFRAERFIFN
jgi:hypothetical protein